MAIRFRCGACSQPIEIDDEWATKTVACPYCRKTITAPAESTLTELDAIPTATPMTREDATPSPPHGASFAIPAAPVQNRIATVALILAALSLGLMILGQVILGPHHLELQELQKLMDSEGDFAKKMEAQNVFFDRYPGAASWLIPAVVSIVVSAVASLAAIVCGVIGATRPSRRVRAILALALASIVPLSFCAGLIASG